jgi:hypothetical protein
MNKPALRIATVVLAAFAAAPIVGSAVRHSASAQGVPEKGRKDQSAQVDDADRSKLRTLQSELIETLGAVRSALEQERQCGFVTSSDVQREDIELLGAELDAQEANTERLVILEKIADQYKELANSAARVPQRMPSSQTVLLRPKADWLKAEIAVERCRLQVAADARN